MILDLSIEWGIDKDGIQLSAEMTQICNGFRTWSTGEDLCKVSMVVLFHQLEDRLAKELQNIDKEPYSLPSLGTIFLYLTE